MQREAAGCSPTRSGYTKDVFHQPAFEQVQSECNHLIDVVGPSLRLRHSSIIRSHLCFIETESVRGTFNQGVNRRPTQILMQLQGGLFCARPQFLQASRGYRQLSFRQVCRIPVMRK